MIRTVVICDRCGAVTPDHPDRITISKHKTETYKDCFGKEHKKSIYKTCKSIHLCLDCEQKFNDFIGGPHND